MPNFNPGEEQNLMALVAALRGGMQPSTGYSLLQDVLGQQAARVDERKARLQSLTDLLVQNAQQGASLKAATAMADAYTRGNNMPPQIEGVLGDLYPGGGPQMVPDTAAMAPTPAPASAAGAVSSGSPYAGYFAPQQGPPPMVSQTPPPGTVTSPLAPPPDPVAEAQAAADYATAQQTIAEASAGPEPAIGDVVTGIYSAINAGTPPRTILQNAMSNPQAATIITENYDALSRIFPQIFPPKDAITQTYPGLVGRP